MGRRVGTVVVAELAVIALVGDLFVVLGSQLAHIAFYGINPIQERVERRTEVETPAAAVADLEDAQGLLDDSRPIQFIRRYIDEF
jgi:hypothetical protein